MSKDSGLHTWPHGGHFASVRDKARNAQLGTARRRTPMEGTGCIFSGDTFAGPANLPSGLGHVVRTPC